MSWTRFREWLEKMSSGSSGDGAAWLRLAIQLGTIAAIAGSAVIYVDSRVDAGTAVIRQQMVELRTDVRSQFKFLTEEMRGLRSDIKDGAVFTVSIQGDIDRLAQRLALELDPIGKAVQRTDARLGRIEQMTRNNGDRLVRVEARLETEFASFGKGVDLWWLLSHVWRAALTALRAPRPNCVMPSLSSRPRCGSVPGSDFPRPARPGVLIFFPLR